MSFSDRTDKDRANHVVKLPVVAAREGDDRSTSSVGGCNGLQPPTEDEAHPKFVWHVDDGPRKNYEKLGRLLAENSDLYRDGSTGSGLLEVRPDGKTRRLKKAADLAPAIVDRLSMVVVRNGKVVSDLPSATHLNATLRTEAFLRWFRVADEVTSNPFYFDDLTLAQPGYNDGGPGKRVLYVGTQPEIAAESLKTIHTFLDVMDFASEADRTNAVAAALTVLLRRRWVGEKPVVVITATKSHAGKGTITEFACGAVGKCSILYDCKDWPMQSQFERQVRMDPDLGIVLLDNVRTDSAGGRSKFIRSAFLESFITNSELKLAAPGMGDAITLPNRFVVIINTNDGALSQDLMNRALSIHLAPKGDVHDRRSKIGNPKLEFLPQNRGAIDAELRGMIERYRQAGCPVDNTVTHSMSRWAREIGGILAYSGFRGFLANQQTHRIDDDLLRRTVGLLGVARRNEALTPAEWAQVAIEQGVVRTLISSDERDTTTGRQRAIGVVLSPRVGETFEASDSGKAFTLRLEGGNRRWAGGNPHVRYKFVVIAERDLPEDD